MTYFGYDGSLGFNKQRIVYDESGHDIRHEFLNDENQLVINLDQGIAGWDKKFDSMGHETETRYFGTDGKVARHKDGPTGLTQRYDREGKLIDGSVVGYDGSHGYTKKNAFFNRDGRIYKIVFVHDTTMSCSIPTTLLAAG